MPLLFSVKPMIPQVSPAPSKLPCSSPKPWPSNCAVMPRQRSNKVGKGSVVICCQVSTSTAPFTGSPRRVCKARSAVSVLPPKSPSTKRSTGPAEEPARSRSDWMRLAIMPRRPLENQILDMVCLLLCKWGANGR